MYHTRESSNVPIFNQYCWNIPSAYENFTHRGSKLFFHFLLTTNINFIEHFNHRRSLSLPLDGLKGVERGKRKEFSFFIHRGLFSCDSSGIPGTRSDRFRWQTLLQTRWKKKYIFFPTGIVNHEAIYLNFFWNEVPFPHANTEHFATLPPLCETLHDEYRCLATPRIIPQRHRRCDIRMMRENERFFDVWWLLLQFSLILKNCYVDW